MGLPSHLWAWQTRNAVAFRILGYLWVYENHEKAEAYVFHTDAEVIDACGVPSRRAFFRALAELRDVGLVERTAVTSKGKRRPGFYLRAFPRLTKVALSTLETDESGTDPKRASVTKVALSVVENDEGGTSPDESIVPKVAVESDESGTSLFIEKTEKTEKTTTSADESVGQFALELDNPAPKPAGFAGYTFKREGTKNAKAAVEFGFGPAEAREVWDALHEAWNKVAGRVGLSERRKPPRMDTDRLARLLKAIVKINDDPTNPDKPKYHLIRLLGIAGEHQQDIAFLDGYRTWSDGVIRTLQDFERGEGRLSEAPETPQKRLTATDRAKADIEATRAERAEMERSENAEAYPRLLSHLNATRAELRESLGLNNGLGDLPLSMAWVVKVDAALEDGRTVEDLCAGVDALAREVRVRVRKGHPDPTSLLSLHRIGPAMWNALSKYPAELDQPKQRKPGEGFSGAI